MKMGAYMCDPLGGIAPDIQAGNSIAWTLWTSLMFAFHPFALRSSYGIAGVLIEARIIADTLNTGRMDIIERGWNH